MGMEKAITNYSNMGESMWALFPLPGRSQHHASFYCVWLAIFQKTVNDKHEHEEKRPLEREEIFPHTEIREELENFFFPWVWGRLEVDAEIPRQAVRCGRCLYCNRVK